MLYLDTITVGTPISVTQKRKDKCKKKKKKSTFHHTQELFALAFANRYPFVAGLTKEKLSAPD